MEFLQEALRGHDGVVMLTWSNWATEPRSNRYHYALRFAKSLPVLFLQPTLEPGTPPTFEDSGLPGMEVISFADPMDAQTFDAISERLLQRGIRKPLLWIYSSLHYEPLLRAWPQALRVYHATEDYLSYSPQMEMDSYQRVAESVRRLLPQVDLLVGVSERVVRAYVEQGGYSGPTVLAPNGCDAGFFEQVQASCTAAPAQRVCLFQGGINRRLDFDLLLGLVQRMPDWEFRFCGLANATLPGWVRLLAEPNVRHMGALGPEALAGCMCEATIGLIPFVQDEWIRNSLPLKAYEYVACGLPVVSIPIDALANSNGLFRFARTAEEFAQAIREEAMTRTEPARLQARRENARRNSYDARFAEVAQEIARLSRARREAPKRLNLAVLYDAGSVHVNTVREHLEAFARYSAHRVVYLPATGSDASAFRWSGRAALDRQGGPDLSAFDVAVVHYSVRVSVEGHMPSSVERQLARFKGLKVLYIQDEYDTPEVTLRWMDRVQPDVVYTCVPAADRERVYSSQRFPRTEFLPTLTGYVPEDPSIDSHALPLQQRRQLIAYRGRKLPPIYGDLGYQKYLIGRRVRELADERGLSVDVEVDDTKRIYGADWYRFLGSARATLGTESGSNLFDFDGSAAALIAAAQARDPHVDYADLREQLQPYERAVRMNQVSPKIFESIRTRTALVLFEGEYSGVVRAGEHYIPLKQDFSNFDEVVRQLQDDEFLAGLTRRAYDDVIRSGRYSYRRFVEDFDADMRQRVLRVSGMQLLCVPLAMQAPGGAVEHLEADAPEGLLVADAPIDRSAKPAFVAHLGTSLPLWPAAAPQPILASPPVQEVALQPAPWQGRTENRALLIRFGGFAWRMLPVPARRGLGWRLRMIAAGNPDVPRGPVTGLMAIGWTLAPDSLQQRVRRRLGIC